MLFLTMSDGQFITLNNGTDRATRIHFLCRENPKQIFTVGIDAPKVVEIVRSNAKVKTKKQHKTERITERAY